MKDSWRTRPAALPQSLTSADAGRELYASFGGARARGVVDGRAATAVVVGARNETFEIRKATGRTVLGGVGNGLALPCRKQHAPA